MPVDTGGAVILTCSAYAPIILPVAYGLFYSVGFIFLLWYIFAVHPVFSCLFFNIFQNFLTEYRNGLATVKTVYPFTVLYIYVLMCPEYRGALKNARKMRFSVPFTYNAYKKSTVFCAYRYNINICAYRQSMQYTGFLRRHCETFSVVHDGYLPVQGHIQGIVYIGT